MTEYRHEAVEVCSHCMGENTVPDWAPEDGWRTTCKHCGERILLCDECIHSEDNPRAFCDWGNGRCFRDMGNDPMPEWFEIIRKGVGDNRNAAYWSDIKGEILCATEMFAELMADRIEELYRKQGEDVMLSTGYYDPEEDKRNGEEDEYTGYWYVDII